MVIIGGFAELIAGAISMGIGGFLASQAERDHYRYLRKMTASRVLRSCDGELEREVYAVLGPVGVDEKTSRAVAKCLRDVEVDSEQGGPSTSSASSRSSSPDTEQGTGLKWSNTVGLSAFLLKFGEGMEEVPTRRLYISAFTIGMGYLLGGFIPLFPYFFGEFVSSNTLFSICIDPSSYRSPCRTCCIDLLLHPDRCGSPNIWCRQGPDHRSSWSRCRRIYLGSSQHLACRRSSSRCSLWTCRNLRSMIPSHHSLCGFLSYCKS